MTIEILDKKKIDKMCKQKYGHDNWAILGTVTYDEFLVNEVAHVDYDEGVIFFKRAEFDHSRTLL